MPRCQDYVKNRMIPCLEEGYTDRHQSVRGSNCWTHHLDMAAAWCPAGWWLWEQSWRVLAHLHALRPLSLRPSLHGASALMFIFLTCQFNHVRFDRAGSMCCYSSLYGWYWGQRLGLIKCSVSVEHVDDRWMDGQIDICWMGVPGHSQRWCACSYHFSSIYHQAHGPSSWMSGLVASSPSSAAPRAPWRVWAHGSLDSLVTSPDSCFFLFALSFSTALHSAHDGGWLELWMLPIRHFTVHKRAGDWCYRDGGLLRGLWQSSEEGGLRSQPLCR